MYELTERDKQSYVEELKNTAQYIIDNAEELISGIEDYTTELSLWINVDDGDVSLRKDYSKRVFRRTCM